jgi:hypothetical protein
MRSLVCVALLITLLPACVPSQRIQPAGLSPTGFTAVCPSGTVEVMLLGTFHFANPGQDAVNPNVDDMRVSRRQAELEDLATRLAAWQPQQLAVEAPFEEATEWQSRYDRYGAGTLPPSRHEIVQIGFRLAHRLGHARVYPIDHHMRIGNDSIAALFERRPELQAREKSITARMQATMDSVDAVRLSTSVIEHLRHTNSEAGLRGGNSFGMFGALMPAGEGGNYGGPQVIARWYERNIRMVHHLHRIHQPGTERILVVVGSGHVPPMRNILDEDPRFCPVSPLRYLQ